MAPKSLPTGSQKKTSTRPNLAKLESTKPTVSPRLKRFDPLTAFKTLSTSQPSSQGSSKGKEKAKDQRIRDHDEEDHRLWVDIYEPTTEGELAVHVRKVEDVRRWLNEAFDGGPSGKLTKYRRILALTGPAGAAKTTTVRVLAREMDFDILEWRNSMGDTPSNIFDGELSGFENNYISGFFDNDREALFIKFETFIHRASSCQNLFTNSEIPLNHDGYASGSSQHSQTRALLKRTPRRQIILLEDLPNILHSETQTKFHETLRSLAASPISTPPVPVILIVSDVGMRGELSDERMASGGWGKDKDGAVDIRTALPRDILSGPYVTLVGFNPIAPTLLSKSLHALLNKHFPTSTHTPISREVLDLIVDSSNGDIRSAVMALQFACVTGKKSKGRSKKSEKKSIVVLESVTRREQGLFLFHLMGRLLYNKRKGDSPSPSAKAKDIQREKAIDALLRDPPKLPRHLQEHARRTSRVDVDTLYADSPIDSSLFSLYIQQNYPQFCDGVEHCEGVADWLSWVDSSGGEAWYQANPHRFHLLTLGTLHSLPSPVTRRSQKIFKPAFFDSLQKEKDAWDGVRDVRGWIMGEGSGAADSTQRVGGWSRTEVAMELGGILKAKDATGDPGSRPPVSHRLFSNLPFALGKPFGNMQQLGDGDIDAAAEPDVDDFSQACWQLKENQQNGGWLDSDDIEDF